MSTPRWTNLFTLLALTGVLAGCGASPRGVARWELRQGGRCDDLALRLRLDSVCRPLRAVDGLGRCELAVIDSDQPGAYAWPTDDGCRVYVTRGLMAMTSDDELAAAVAHEMGHLVDGGHVRIASLTGDDYVDAERRADAIGCRLLHEAGFTTDAMRNLLSKLAQTNPHWRKALALRANSLSPRNPSP